MCLVRTQFKGEKQTSALCAESLGPGAEELLREEKACGGDPASLSGSECQYGDKATTRQALTHTPALDLDTCPPALCEGSRPD